jgi:hypothetical protein
MAASLASRERWSENTQSAVSGEVNHPPDSKKPLRLALEEIP